MDINYNSKINQMILAKLVSSEVIMCATDIVEYILQKSVEGDETPFSCEDVENAENIEDGISEWYFVTNGFANKLKKHGEVVINNGLYSIWGRSSSGQSIILDGAIRKIGRDMKILRGMENDWSELPKLSAFS